MGANVSAGELGFTGSGFAGTQTVMAVDPITGSAIPFPGLCPVQDGYDFQVTAAGEIQEPGFWSWVSNFFTGRSNIFSLEASSAITGAGVYDLSKKQSFLREQDQGILDCNDNSFTTQTGEKYLLDATIAFNLQQSFTELLPKNGKIAFGAKIDPRRPPTGCTGDCDWKPPLVCVGDCGPDPSTYCEANPTSPECVEIGVDPVCVTATFDGTAPSSPADLLVSSFTGESSLAGVGSALCPKTTCQGSKFECMCANNPSMSVCSGVDVVTCDEDPTQAACQEVDPCALNPTLEQCQTDDPVVAGKCSYPDAQITCSGLTATVVASTVDHSGLELSADGDEVRLAGHSYLYSSEEPNVVEVAGSFHSAMRESLPGSPAYGTYALAYQNVLETIERLVPAEVYGDLVNAIEAGDVLSATVNGELSSDGVCRPNSDLNPYYAHVAALSSVQVPADVFSAMLAAAAEEFVATEGGFDVTLDGLTATDAFDLGEGYLESYDLALRTNNEYFAEDFDSICPDGVDSNFDSTLP